LTAFAMGKPTNTLPESLELLLDTMCNTFGGIMFIAIALTIVAQVSNQHIKLQEQTMITLEEKEAMHQRMKTLSLEVENSERKLQEHITWENLLDPRNRPLIEKLLEQRKNNTRILSSIALQRKKLQDSTEALAKEHSELERLKSSVEQSMLENKKLDDALEMRRIMLQEQREKLQAQLDKLEETIAALQEVINQGPPKETIAFSMETETSAREYMVLLSNGHLYREPRNTEVKQERFLNFLELKPTGQGWKVTPGENQLWQQALTSIDKSYYYIRLVLDNNSFDSLLKVKKFLRENGYLVTWGYSPSFTFQLVDDLNIRVSQ
jgi:hypothetical protein